MSQEKNKQNSDEKEMQGDNSLAAFFDLLLKIDMRNNPDNYKTQQSHD